ncbi:MAG: PspC domain-containing protein [Sphingomicrobium sp.]|nr:PspC domain-containing protein [Sphingomonadales bacterium]
MTITTKPAIIDRSEPILGVCEALGDDFGVSPHWFRAALFPLLLWAPLSTVGGYLALALLVLASRLLFPDVREAVPAASDAAPSLAAADEQDRIPLAA